MPSCRFRILASLVLLVPLAACASGRIAHTPGEIPRDTYGRPVWALIEPSVPTRAPCPPCS